VLPAEDRRVLGAFAAQAAVMLDRQRLATQAAEARRLSVGNRIRSALLAAVSDDVHTPLASVKAAVSSLRQTDVQWSERDRAELLPTIEESTDQLDGLLSNLLDLSGPQTHTVTPLLRPVGLEEVVPQALTGLSGDSVHLELPEDLPAVPADPGLLKRVVANLVQNMGPRVREGDQLPPRLHGAAAAQAGARRTPAT